MGYPHHPPPPLPPPRNTVDVAVSVTVVVLTVLMVAGSALMGFFILAFLDYCPPESCSVSGAVTSVMAGVGVAALASLFGVVTVAIRVGRRLTSWPYALAALVMCVVALGGGLFAYNAAVGY